MERDFKGIEVEETMSKFKVRIKKLSKVFGSNPKKMIEYINNGISKNELLDQYNHVLGLNNVNIDIPASSIQVIMGLSGSGKSTLIRHVNRLIEPTMGEIVVDGDNVLNMNKLELRDFRRSRTSMVFQRFALLPHRSVIENVGYGLVIQGVSKVEILERSQKWVNRVGLSGFESYYPAQLSGGMQQRVGLARALATNAEILLMDEAFSALDPLIREEMQDVLLGLQAELKKTIIFITHDLDEALRLGDQIAILRDGMVVQEGSPQDIILNPIDSYVTDFTKNINRGRVLKVVSIMENKILKVGPKIEQSIAIEEALQILSKSRKKSGIVTYKTKPVGSIHIDTIIAAMHKPLELNATAKSYT